MALLRVGRPSGKPPTLRVPLHRDKGDQGAQQRSIAVGGLGNAQIMSTTYIQAITIKYINTWPCQKIKSKPYDICR